MEREKGFLKPAYLFFTLAMIFLLGAYWLVQPTTVDDQIVCTQEARSCPDGSSVGRTGSNCAFAACPDISGDEEIIFNDEARKLCGPQPPAICAYGLQLGCRIKDKRWNCYPNEELDTSTWKTYRNEKYGFEMKYPENWYNTFEFHNGTVEFASFSRNAYGQGGVRPSLGMTVTIAHGICNYPSSDFVKYEIYKDVADLTKTVCLNNFQITLALDNADLQKDEHKQLLEHILSTFKFIKVKDEKMSCEISADCTLLLCSGAVNKEWAKNAPPEPPCALYVGYTAQCTEQKCIAIKP